MVVPIDDHIVHRGDGVFEAIKMEHGIVYALKQHMDRMVDSMRSVQMTSPMSVDRMVDIVLQTARASKAKDAVVRVYTSRGPGSFTPNPYESIGAQFYVVITARNKIADSKLKDGVKMGMSKVPVKPGIFATTKSCNYLPNVLMKKEAVDAGLDYTVSVDENGFIAEGSTENVGCVTAEGDLVIPKFDRTLKGVTATRVLELSQKLVAAKILKSIQNRNLKVSEMTEAREIHVYGTTIDVLPVGKFEGRVLKDFSVAMKLREMIVADLQNPDYGIVL